MNKKTILLAATLCVASVLQSAIEVSTLWQISKAGGNLEQAKDFSGVGGLGANLNRGMALLYEGATDVKVLITTGSSGDGNAINYYNGMTGQWQGALNTEPLNKLAVDTNHKIADLEVCDGKIYSVSLSVIGKDVLISRWDNVSAEPVVTTLPIKTDFRIEKLSISGSVNDGTAKLWMAGSPTSDLAFPAPEGKELKVAYFPLSKTGDIDIAGFKTFARVPATNIMSNTTLLPDGSMLVKTQNFPLYLVSSDGTVMGNTQAINPELTLSQTVRYVGTNPGNGRYYFLLSSYSRSTDLPNRNGCVRTKVYSMKPGNLNTIVCEATLPVLGDEAVGNNMNDNDYLWFNNSLYVLSLSPNNGFGCFRIKNLYEAPVGRSTDRFDLVWENSMAGFNPSFYVSVKGESDPEGVTTGLAYGKVQDKESVYVVKQIYYDDDQPNGSDDIWGPHGDYRKNIFIHDAQTGDLQGQLVTNTIWGGTFQDAAVTKDGVLFTAFVKGTGENIRGYNYPSHSHVPANDEPNFSYDSECPDILSGHIDITGSLTDNSAKLYLTSQSSETSVNSSVYQFGVENGRWFGLVPDNEYTIPVAGKGSVAVKTDGSFYWNTAGSGNTLFHSSNLQSGAELEGSVVKFLANKDGKDYIAVLNENKADVYAVTPDEPQSLQLWGSTPTLGATANTSSTGDLDVSYDQDGSPILYVLSANNGVAAWKVNLTVTGIDQAETLGQKVYSANGRIVVAGAEGLISIYGIGGNTISSSSTHGTYQSELLMQGIYIVKVNGKATKVAVQ